MHQEMLKIWNIGGIIHEIQNDCIYWSRKSNIPSPLSYSPIYGDFKIETTKIQSYISFGPKTTVITFYDKNNVLQSSIKARGFSLKGELIQQILTNTSFLELLSSYVSNGQVTSIPISQTRHSRDLRALKITCESKTHNMSNVINMSRVIFNDYTTKPYGYRK